MNWQFIAGPAGEEPNRTLTRKGVKVLDDCIQDSQPRLTFSTATSKNAHGSPKASRCMILSKLRCQILK